MNPVLLWIGPRTCPPGLAQVLAAQNVELLAAPSAEQALAQAAGRTVAVAVIAHDEKEGAAQAQRVAAARPDAQVLLATALGLPRGVLGALSAGATGLLDFRSQQPPEIVLALQRAFQRFHRLQQETHLLLRLRALNEEFLKTIVNAERRNIELEQKLLTEANWGLAANEGAQRVLIVDDEAVVRDVLELLLAKAGHEFTSVDSGEAALAALQKARFDLVLTDKNLPGITGVDVLREAKRVAPDIDVIMMTGYSSTESAISAVELGASGYLLKPFDHIQTVREKIDAVLERRRELQRKRSYLHLIKDRNKAFLDQYRLIRADLEQWLASRGLKLPPTP